MWITSELVLRQRLYFCYNPRRVTTTFNGGLIVTKYDFNFCGQLFQSNPFANLKSKVCSKRDMTIMISCLARFLPAQFAGPKENARNAFMSFWNLADRWEFSSSSESFEFSHRSGTNSAVRGEKYVGFRWKIWGGTHTCVPSGRKLYIISWASK